MPDANTPDFPWNNVRILVTDDESEMREIFATWLSNLGCQVVEARDGVEALEKSRQTKFDVIITDVRMPRLDGVGLAKKLGEAVEYIPVLIFVSGFHDLPAAEVYDLGIEAILSKPCKKTQLIQSVLASLWRRQLRFADTQDQPAVSRLEKYFAQSAEQSGLAIGRGGFSLMWETSMELETRVEYQFNFAEGALRGLEGSGIVRWIEELHGQQRIGIEFTGLSEESRREVFGLLGEACPRSFIPQSCPVTRSAKL